MKQLYRYMCLAAIVVGCIISAVTQANSAIDPQVKSILSKQQDYFSKLPAYKFKCKWQLIFYGRDEPIISKNECFFICKGIKFRNQNHNTQKVIQAFNGKDYQFLLYDASMLSVSRNANQFGAPMGGLHPLVDIFSFSFLTDESPTLQPMYIPGRWKMLSDYVTSIDNTNMLGHDGIKMVFKGPRVVMGTAVIHEVFFAADLGYLPIHKKSIFGDGKSAEVTLTDVKSFKTKTDSIFFPTSFEIKNYSADGNLMSTLTATLDPALLVIGANVDDSVFTIPRSSARHFQEQNQSETIKQ